MESNKFSILKAEFNKVKQKHVLLRISLFVIFVAFFGNNTFDSIIHKIQAQSPSFSYTFNYLLSSEGVSSLIFFLLASACWIYFFAAASYVITKTIFDK